MTQPATYARKPNVGTPKFEADPLNSTYRWEFYLTPGHARNSVPLMDGYSKGMGFENTNKLELLYRKLINPVLPYLTRCDVIVVYQQTPGLPKEFHPKLIELFANNYRTFGWVDEDAFLNNFLDTYYTEYVKKGKMPPLEDRRKNVRQSVYMAELDHSKYQFATIVELQQFCRSKVDKYSAQCMHGWYYRHADFQPELFESDITDAVAHAVHTAPSAEQAQAAMNAMHSRHRTKR